MRSDDAWAQTDKKKRKRKSHAFKRYLRVSVEHLVLQDHLPADLRAVIHDDVHVRPGAELPLPVCDGGQRGDDEEGPADPHAEDLVQKGDGLDGLSQTHLICEYAVFSRRKNKDAMREQASLGGLVAKRGRNYAPFRRTKTPQQL